jgi:hypothetical protein
VARRRHISAEVEDDPASLFAWWESQRSSDTSPTSSVEWLLDWIRSRSRLAQYGWRSRPSSLVASSTESGRTAAGEIERCHFRMYVPEESCCCYCVFSRFGTARGDHRPSCLATLVPNSGDPPRRCGVTHLMTAPRRDARGGRLRSSSREPKGCDKIASGISYLLRSIEPKRSSDDAGHGRGAACFNARLLTCVAREQRVRSCSSLPRRMVVSLLIEGLLCCLRVVAHWAGSSNLGHIAESTCASDTRLCGSGEYSKDNS